MNNGRGKIAEWFIVK